MATSLIINATNAIGKKVQKSVTDVNPSAANAELKTFGQKVVQIMGTTYVDTERVEKITVDTDDTRKLFRNLQIEGATLGGTATISGAMIAGGEAPSFAVFYVLNSSSSVSMLTTTTIESEDPTVAKFTVNVPNNAGILFACNGGNNTFYDSCVRASVS